MLYSKKLTNFICSVIPPVKCFGPHSATRVERRSHNIHHRVEMNDITKTKVQHDKWNNIWSLDTISNTNNKYVEVIWILKEKEINFLYWVCQTKIYASTMSGSTMLFSSPQNAIVTSCSRERYHTITSMFPCLDGLIQIRPSYNA